MAKTYKRGRDAKTGQFVSVKEAEKHRSTTVIETVKVGHSTKEPTFRTIKSAPKQGKISRESIKNAVKTISSSTKKK